MLPLINGIRAIIHPITDANMASVCPIIDSSGGKNAQMNPQTSQMAPCTRNREGRTATDESLGTLGEALDGARR